jgi:integrase
MDLTAALGFAEAAKAANTRRAYASDWADFIAWVVARDTTPLPCPPGLLAAYLAALAAAGRAAAIAHAHQVAGFASPTASPALREVLRGIRHALGTAPRRKTPATAELVARMVAVCPDSPIGTRDRALLTLGFAGAFRRSELLALDMADLIEVADGLHITIRRSKTDQEGAGQEIAIPRGYRLRPVETLQIWLTAAAISEGRCWRRQYAPAGTHTC